MAAGTAYAKRYGAGFTDGDNAKPVDAQYLNANETALLQLIGVAPTVDGQVAQWDFANTRFGPALLLNKNIDPAAAIAKSKLDFTGVNGIVDADIAGSAAIAQSKLATGLSGPPGTQLAKDTINTNTAAISATTEGTSVAVITGSSFTYDGATEVKIEFWAPTLNVSGAPTTVFFVLYRGVTVLGQSIYVSDVVGAISPAPYVVFHETPPAGAAAYTIKAFVNANNVVINAGAGGAGALLKAFLKVTKV